MANTQARDSEARDAELVELFFSGKKLDIAQMKTGWKTRAPVCLGEACYAAWLQVGRVLYAGDLKEYEQITQGEDRRRQDRAVLARERELRTNPVYAC